MAEHQKHPRQILLVGGDGLIGKTLQRRWGAEKLLCTTRRLKTQSAEARGKAERSWQNPQDYIRQLANYNVYVAPRRFEGIGMTFLEAMAMGMCVVAENQPTANEYILSGQNGILYGGDREKIYPPRQVELAELAQMGKQARETIRRIHGEWLAKKVEIGRCVEAMLQRRIEPEVPPAGLLSLTIDFWQDQQRFWKSFGSGAPRIWRSGAIEKKGRQARSVSGRIRMFWRHLKAAARRDTKRG